MSTNTKEKTTIILCDISPDTNETDINTFLSQYKEKITSIQLSEKKPYKAMVCFKDYNSANECRINMNQKKIKNKSIRIVWDERDFLQKNKDNKNNLYIKGIPKTKTSREIYEYFLKFGDIFSAKINEDEKGNNNGTAFVTYYNPEDAKKAIEETNGKKIWDSDMDVQYKTNDRYYNNNDNNLKINICNLPENFTDEDLNKLCEEFGKIHICNVNKTQKGKYAIVKFSNEQEAKNAMEKLNNKKIENKKIYVKEVKDNHYYNYNYNNNNNKPNYQQNYYFNNNPMMRYEESLENNNLYVRNIPYTATEEDLKKTFGQFGKITSIKLELDVVEKKDDKETKKLVANKGFGYISFEKIEEAKKALESLNGKYLQGFESWTKALMIDYFISKDKRQNMIQNNYYGIQNNAMIFPPGIPPQYPPYPPVMMPMPIPNQYNSPYMWNTGIYKNNGYNNNYKPRFNNKGYQHRGRGGHRGGYYKNNYQKKNNNDKKNENTNINSQMNNNNKVEENKLFDYEKYNSLSTKEEKKDFLGERLFNVIQEHLKNTGVNVGVDIIGKITGMIIEIPDENEIIEILEKPSVLDSRVKEALSLLNTNK